MTEITYLQSLELIDIAVKENRLYHYNGGQAYLRLSMESNVLMIVDHTALNKTRIEIMDGTTYFKQYGNANHEYSKRLRDDAEKYGTFVERYNKQLTLHEMDLV